MIPFFIPIFIQSGPGPKLSNAASGYLFCSGSVGAICGLYKGATTGLLTPYRSTRTNTEIAEESLMGTLIGTVAGITFPIWGTGLALNRIYNKRE